MHNIAKWDSYCIEDWMRDGCDKSKAEQINIIICNSIPHTYIGDEEKGMPKNINLFVNLQKFFFRYTSIQKIPPQIGMLANLQILDISYNQIVELPREIKDLHNLEHFYCSHNKIKEIPIEIKYLVSMTYFDCSFNEIKIIPIEIMECKKLSELIYSDNDGIYVAPEIQTWLEDYERILDIA